jgi:GTP-binding protein Era
MSRDLPDAARPSDDHRFGFVAIVGRANVGKSTLLNRLVGRKVAIVSEISQTTRHRILGVRNLPGGQIAFLDSPGFHKPYHRLGEVLVETARQVAGEADLILFLVDAAAGIGVGDRHVLGEIEAAVPKVPIVAVINKADAINKGKLLPMIEQAVEEWGCREAVPISAATGDNLDRLLEVVRDLLPPGVPHYPPDFVSDQDERRMVAEIVREKLLARLRQEVPHAIAVRIEEIDERDDGLVDVVATICVERESQKGIVIGSRGRMLKEIGKAARVELETRWQRKVYLQLWVKVREAWRDRAALLREFDVLP